MLTSAVDYPVFFHLHLRVLQPLLSWDWEKGKWVSIWIEPRNKSGNLRSMAVTSQMAVSSLHTGASTLRHED